MNKLTILQLSTGLGVGGAEKVVVDLATLLDKNKFNVFVIGINKSDDRLTDLKAAGIKAFSLNIRKKFFEVINGFSRVVHFCQENNVQVIHAHMPHAYFFAIVVKLFKPSTAIVFTSHNVILGLKVRDFIIKITKKCRFADIVFSNEFDTSIYKKENLIILPNGIDASAFKNLFKKNDSFTFINVARLQSVKNQIALIHAMEIFKEKKLNAQLQIVGEGEERSRLEHEITSKKLEGYVQLLGLRKDIPNLLARAHAFVMSSLWEGMPISILEAGAASLPVITTPVGSIPTLINESNGYLIKDNNLQNMMMDVFYNYGQAEKKGKKLQQLIQESYDIRKIVEAHEKLYLSTVKEIS